jgi:hypothetical protein
MEARFKRQIYLNSINALAFEAVNDEGEPFNLDEFFAIRGVLFRNWNTQDEVATIEPDVDGDVVSYVFSKEETEDYFEKGATQCIEFRLFLTEEDFDNDEYLASFVVRTEQTNAFKRYVQ